MVVQDGGVEQPLRTSGSAGLHQVLSDGGSRSSSGSTSDLRAFRQLNGSSGRPVRRRVRQQRRSRVEGTPHGRSARKRAVSSFHHVCFAVQDLERPPVNCPRCSVSNGAPSVEGASATGATASSSPWPVRRSSRSSKGPRPAPGTPPADRTPTTSATGRPTSPATRTSWPSAEHRSNSTPAPTAVRSPTTGSRVSAAASNSSTPRFNPPSWRTGVPTAASCPHSISTRRGRTPTG